MSDSNPSAIYFGRRCPRCGEVIPASMSGEDNTATKCPNSKCENSKPDYPQ